MQHFRNHKRAGFTLLEVLIATSVIMVGIFGIASAIGLCEQLFKTSFRSDMAADCGRAALETMLAENFVEDNFTSSGASATNFTPVLKTCNWTIDNNVQNLSLVQSQKDAADFKCKDHLRQNNAGINLEENPPNYDTTLKSDYAWVGTIHQISGEYCEVSAAVAYKPERDLDSDQCARLQFSASNISDELGVVRVLVGGGSDEDYERLVAGQYVFLWSNKGGHWYRIGSFYNGQMELYGPQWTYSSSGNIYTPGGVVSAYTQIVPIQNR